MLKKLVITIGEEKINSMNKIMDELSERGMQVLKTYPFGVVIVSGESFLANDLRKIDGIESVSVEETVQIPPSDSEIQ